VQAGFSYDTLINGTLSLAPDNTYPDLPLPKNKPIPPQNNTFYVGTFPSSEPFLAINGSANAARALWKFTQVFTQEFPEYKTKDSRISLWTESYGGKYGPTSVSFFEQQNQKIRSGKMKDPSTKKQLNIDTLGVINGCVDVISMHQYYPKMAYNNTYGVEVINQTIYNKYTALWDAPNGVLENVMKCRDLAAKLDPTNQNDNEEVNDVCFAAYNISS
jgi:carboxypeptidase C (cathepsin A)